MESTQTSLWRTLLVLGRVSNLPTVWSNCTAAWLIAGGGRASALLTATLGASLLYTGGMYLNDAVDADFDRRHRANRPIPNGAIGAKAVWIIGIGLLATGTTLMLVSRSAHPWLTALLVAAIVIYDLVHKQVSFAPVLMAACRVFLFLALSSSGHLGLTGLGVWSSLSLGCWIVGLSYLARRESLLSAPLNAWPLLLMGAPLLLAALANTGDTRLRSVLLSLVLLVWTWRSIRLAFGTQARNVGGAVSGLLAGICLVDLLAVAPGYQWGLVFLAFFGLSLLFQRHVPAT